MDEINLRIKEVTIEWDLNWENSILAHHFAQNTYIFQAGLVSQTVFTLIGD